MSKKGETTVAQEQPYDSTFKALLDDVTLVLLSFLFGEVILFAQELKESLSKQDTIKPVLRVDCVYLIHRRSRQKSEVGHVEFETAPGKNIGTRLLEYTGILHNKYDKPVVQVLVCPFETPNLPTPPYQMKSEEEVLLERHYRVVALWKYEARMFIEQEQVELYALLPTMKGATYELLAQALSDMRAFHAGNETRLCNHLLWFDALLGRTTTVTREDKRRVRQTMIDEFRSLLDEGYFVQKRVAEGRAEGEAKGREEGLTEGLQEALLMVIESRFPTLLDFAHKQVKQAKGPEALRLVLKGVTTASGEEYARLLLELLVA
jgi:hypothetical protein